MHQGEFFHEFLTECPVEPERVLSALANQGILGGLPVNGGILWCATEKCSRAEMDRLARIAREAVG